MENDLLAIVAQAEASQASISSRSDWEQAKAAILGPKGALTQASKLIGKLPNEEKPAFGQALNKVKKEIEALFASSLSKIEEQSDLAALGDPYDPTLPAIPNRSAFLHPLSATRRKVVSIFRKLGFTVTEATEVETEWFCFDALNTPEDHPARDAQDTLFSLRNQNGPMFPKGQGSPSFTHPYFLSPDPYDAKGKTTSAGDCTRRCFRRDTVDATHSANFHQIEGLCIDRKVTALDLKGVLDHF